jgi:hypothetical protein
MTKALGAARFTLRLAALGTFAALSAGACSREVELGSDSAGARAGSGGTGGAAGTSGGHAGTAGSVAQGGGVAQGGSAGESGAGGQSEPGCVPVACHGKLYQCGNCMDDDGDGKFDAADPECTGPCDNSEASFDVDLPGAGADKCTEDCFFDNGNGAGNDGCRFSYRCDPLSVGPDYPPSGLSSCAYDETASVPGGGSCAELSAAQAPACANVCGPLTPNGCDCFGCCEIPANSEHYVSLAGGASECTTATLDDPRACPPCTPVPSCANPCDACESCVGRAGPASSCTSGAGCNGLKACDASVIAPCPQGFYCITGCCVPEPR